MIRSWSMNTSKSALMRLWESKHPLVQPYIRLWVKIFQFGMARSMLRSKRKPLCSSISMEFTEIRDSGPNPRDLSLKDSLLTMRNGQKQLMGRPETLLHLCRSSGANAFAWARPSQRWPSDTRCRWSCITLNSRLLIKKLSRKRVSTLPRVWRNLATWWTPW